MGVCQFVETKLTALCAPENWPQFLKLFPYLSFLSTQIPDCFGSRHRESLFSTCSLFSSPLLPQLSLEIFDQKAIARIPFLEKAHLSPRSPHVGGMRTGGKVIHYFLLNNIPIFLSIPPPKLNILKHFAA